MRLLVVLLLALLLPASSAAAATRLEGPAVRPWMHSCLSKSRVPTPDLSIQVTPSTVLGKSWISPWPGGEMVLDGLSRSRDNCRVLIHEIGHLYDWTLLSPQNRQLIGCRIFNFRSSFSWWAHLSGSQWVMGSEGEEGPVEWFAEAYALAALSPRVPPRGRYWFDDLLSATGSYAGYGLSEHQLSRSGFIRFRRLLRYIPRVRAADRSDRDQRALFSCLPGAAAPAAHSASGKSAPRPR